MRRRGIGNGKRGQGVIDLAGDAEALAAGGDDPHARPADEEPFRHRGAALQQVLAIVEEDEELALAHIGRERVDDGALWVLLHLEDEGRHLGAEHLGLASQRLK